MNIRKIYRIADVENSTLTGMNGGDIESPDGSMIVYASKPDLSESYTELWVCNRDLTGHRKVYTLSCMNHNGPSASFVDNDTVVFRDETDGILSFILYDVKRNEEKSRVYGKMGHRASGGMFPVSVRESQLLKNNAFPEIKECGVYMMNVRTGKITYLISDEEINEIALSHGLGINPNTCDVSHLQLSPDCSAVMMRMGVPNCPTFGALGCMDLATRKTHLISDKPVHQLWFDNDTYMATRQFEIDGRIDMATSYIARFSKDGEELEVLGGIGNHIDGNADRTLFAGDRCYPGYAANVYVYERGNKTPLAEIEIADLPEVVWKRQVHPNPSFAGNGKRLYFNRPVSNDRTEASFIETDEI